MHAWLEAGIGYVMTVVCVIAALGVGFALATDHQFIEAALFVTAFLVGAGLCFWLERNLRKSHQS